MREAARTLRQALMVTWILTFISQWSHFHPLRNVSLCCFCSMQETPTDQDSAEDSVLQWKQLMEMLLVVLDQPTPTNSTAKNHQPNGLQSSDPAASRYTKALWSAVVYDILLCVGYCREKSNQHYRKRRWCCQWSEQLQLLSHRTLLLCHHHPASCVFIEQGQALHPVPQWNWNTPGWELGPAATICLCTGLFQTSVYTLGLQGAVLCMFQLPFDGLQNQSFKALVDTTCPCAKCRWFFVRTSHWEAQALKLISSIQ